MPAARPSGFRKRRVEGGAGRREIEILHELAGFLGAGLAVHAEVFPFDRQRAGVLDLVQARMISSKSTLPRPGERNSQPRRGSPNVRWLPRMPLRPFRCTMASLTCT